MIKSVVLPSKVCTKALQLPYKELKLNAFEFLIAFIFFSFVIIQALKFQVGKVEGPRQLRCKGPKMELTLTQPDDWHLHLRDGDMLEAVVCHR